MKIGEEIVFNTEAFQNGLPQAVRAKGHWNGLPVRVVAFDRQHSIVLLSCDELGSEYWFAQRSIEIMQQHNIDKFNKVTNKIKWR